MTVPEASGQVFLQAWGDGGEGGVICWTVELPDETFWSPNELYLVVSSHKVS